eukprot:scaffold95059_cov66-Phaeocystis_antarctica.AAC.1
MLAGSVATPALVAAAAAAAAARAALAPTDTLAAPPIATVAKEAAAGGALEANKAERSAVVSLANTRAVAAPHRPQYSLLFLFKG